MVGRLRRAQLAVEFIASTMIFLFAVILVVSSVFRGYAAVSDGSRAIALETKAEALALALTSSEGNGFGLPEGGLDLAKLLAVPEGNYSALRERAKFKEDYRLEISYLPSIVISTHFENTLAMGPGETASSFDTFSADTPINLTVISRSFEGATTPGTRTFVLLVDSQDRLVDVKEAESSGRVSLQPAGEGVYTLLFFSYDRAERLYGTREISIGVVSSA